jgi:hypothetical protein
MTRTRCASIVVILAALSSGGCGPEDAPLGDPPAPHRPLTEADIAELAIVPPNCTRLSAGEESVDIVGPSDGVVRLWADGTRDSGRIHWLYVNRGVVPDGVTARFTLREAVEDRRVLHVEITVPAGASLQPATDEGPRFRLLINYGPCGPPGERYDATTLFERITNREFPAVERAERWWLLSDLDALGGTYIAAAPRDAFPTPGDVETEARDTIPAFAPMPPTVRGAGS